MDHHARTVIAAPAILGAAESGHHGPAVSALPSNGGRAVPAPPGCRAASDAEIDWP